MPGQNIRQEERLAVGIRRKAAQPFRNAMLYRPSIIAALLASVFVRFAVAAPEPDKVAQVAEGKLKEARASYWGFDAADSTAILQAAIDSKVPRLIVDKQAGPWVSGPLRLVGDQELVFGEGVELVAKRGFFRGRTESLLSASRVDNVKILGIGKGATIRMNKADYHSADYEKSEWRHALALCSVTNVHVENVSFVSSGGDGIYLGVSKEGIPCRNIVIRKVVCDDNNRQGISVISADKLLIEDCVLKNTDGTAPQAGIDFEPNGPNERLTDCIVRNCLIEGNHGHGIHCDLAALRKSKTPVSLRIENCLVRDNKRSGFNLLCRDGTDGMVKGNCTIVDCAFERNEQAGIDIQKKSLDGIALTFENTKIVDCGNDPNVEASIRIVFCGKVSDGGIDFGEVDMTDAPDRNPICLADYITRPERMTGLIKLRRNDQLKIIRVDDAWIDANRSETGVE